MLSEEFIDYIASVRRYSVRTQQVYRAALDGFYSWAAPDGADGTDAELAPLCPSTIRSWEVHMLEEQHLGPSTVHLNLSALSSYCRYLTGRGLLDGNPVRTLPRPKSPRRLPQFYHRASMDGYFGQGGIEELTPEEAAALHKRVRSRLIMNLLYDTGIRRSELIALNVQDVDLRRGVLNVRGKGDKMREIPLVGELCEEISLYLQSVAAMTGCSAPADGPLLQTDKGQRLYPVFVDRTVKAELEGVEGITGRKSPHVLRHTLATELLDAGTDLNSIKELLGHSSLAATQVYTHLSVERLKKVYETAHPRAKKGGNYGDKD